MTLLGGRHGLLQNSSNICNNPPLATISALGQNNIGARFSSELRGQCKKKGKKAERGGGVDEAPGYDRGFGRVLLFGGHRRRGPAEIAQKGNLRVNVNGKLSPKKLPRNGVGADRGLGRRQDLHHRRHPAAAAEDDCGSS